MLTFLQHEITEHCDFLLLTLPETVFVEVLFQDICVLAVSFFFFFYNCLEVLVIFTCGGFILSKMTSRPVESVQKKMTKN